MKLVTFTALLSVLLISSTVYLIMDQSKTELMNFPGHAEDDQCLFIHKYPLFPSYLGWEVREENICETPKKFTISFFPNEGAPLYTLTTKCLGEFEYEYTALGFQKVENVVEEDC